MIHFLISVVFFPICMGYTPFDRILSNKSVSQKELPDFMEGIQGILHTYTHKTYDMYKTYETYETYDAYETYMFLLIDYKENRFHLMFNTCNKDNSNEIYHLISEETVRKITTEELMELFHEYKFLYYEYVHNIDNIDNIDNVLNIDNVYNNFSKIQEILSIINQVVYV